MADIDPKLAAGELLRRQRARSSLVEFSQAIDIPGVPLNEVPEDLIEDAPAKYAPIESNVALHHLLIMQAIERCILKPRGRLIVAAPPGSAKSTYGSVLAPAWAMGRKPNTQVILASYATTIAAKQSRKVRSIMRDPKYTSLWAEKPTLLEDQRAVDDWQLTNGSSMMAGGLLAGLTGNRCDLLVLDDPVANREQADSPALREKTYNEYIDTAMTRAKPKMSVLIIMTRWHEQDLVGSILPEDYNGESGMIDCRDGQTWEVLSIPAEAEREDDPLGRKIGEFLWPTWFSRAHWSIWRDNPRAARTWSALYQQRPAPFAGIYFNREMFKRFDLDKARNDDDPEVLPKSLRLYSASDFATMAPRAGQKEPDYTQHLVMGIDHKGDMWFIDNWGGQTETDVGIAQFIRLIGLHRPIRHFNEGGLIDKSIGPAIRSAMQHSQKFVAIESLPSLQDKAIKLQAFHARATAGTVHIPIRRKWAEKLIDELVKFPAGRHDDMADCCGLLGRGVDLMVDARIVSAETKPSLQPFTEAWLMYNDRNDKPKMRYF